MSESNVTNNNPNDSGGVAGGEGRPQDSPPLTFGIGVDVGTDQQEANDLGSEPNMPDSSVSQGEMNDDAVSFQISWQGSPNYWAGRSGNKIVAICEHIIQDSLANANSWVKSSASEVSSHFGVGRDGRIYQWVRTENSAWANGIVNRADTSIPWLADAVQRGVNLNLLTLSIEHEGVSGQAFTETEYQATLWLHHHLIANYGIQVDRQHIIGHNQIDAITRSNCPGTAFPWERLMNDLGSSQSSSGSGNSPSGADVPPIVGPVPGMVSALFAPAIVAVEGAYVRSYPGFGAGIVIFRKLPAGTQLNFVGYTDQGGAYQGNTRWYLIDAAQQGGWIHSMMVK